MKALPQVAAASLVPSEEEATDVQVREPGPDRCTQLAPESFEV